MSKRKETRCVKIVVDHNLRVFAVHGEDGSIAVATFDELSESLGGLDIDKAIAARKAGVPGETILELWDEHRAKRTSPDDV